jgi:hypothetical protein
MRYDEVQDGIFTEGTRMKAIWIPVQTRLPNLVYLLFTTMRFESVTVCFDAKYFLS